MTPHFDWTFSVGHLITILSAIVTVAGAVWRLERSTDRRILRLENVIEPVTKLFGGNGRPPLGERLAVLEREVAEHAGFLGSHAHDRALTTQDVKR